MRDMTKRLFLQVGAVLAAWALTGSALAADKPLNIVFFLSDDQRADFLGCAGHPIVQTPNIDGLAAKGVRFENAFVTTAICAASRATIFSGLWERSHQYTFGTPRMAPSQIAVSYPAVLRKQGYRTGFTGKFGVGVEKSAPTEVMFDFYQPLNRNPYFKKMPDGTRRHLTDITGDTAIEFLETCQADQPFCLSVSFNAAHAEDNDKVNHYPWPPAEDGLYDDVTVPEPIVPRSYWETLPKYWHAAMHRDRYHWRWDTDEKYQRNSKAYFRMITGLDRNIGRVLAKLDEMGVTDNTLVIFTGDNGYYQGSRGFAGKWSHWEESLRVPLVIFDPRLAKDLRGRVLQPMALNVDLPATMVAAASGGQVPATYQGRSLLPLVHGEVVKDWRTDFFCEHLMDRFDIPKYEGVRGSRYVYARYFENLPEGEFLYDLQFDPLQLNNLAGDLEHVSKLEEMRKRCDELMNQYGGKYIKEEFLKPRD